MFSSKKVANEYARDRKDRLIKQGLCSKCGHEKDTEEFKLCLDCRNYMAEWFRKTIERDKDHYYEKQRERKHRRDPKGLCVRCGSRKQAKGRKSCQICLDKEKVFMNNKIEKRKQAGLCVKCGNHKSEQGLFVCPTCREKNRVAAAKKYAKKIGKTL